MYYGKLARSPISAVTAILYFSMFPAHAQISQGGMPLSYENDKIEWVVPTITTPSFDVNAMLAEDEVTHASKDTPYRFGKNITIGRNLNNSGQWHELPNGDRVWLLAINSPGAYSLNLTFDLFELPIGGRLHVYSPDFTHVLGAYTHENNSPELGFGTYPIPGDHIIIEYFEPASTAGLTNLQIENVTHAYRDLDVVARGIGDSGPCNNNVICPEGDDWRDQINSVAMIVVNGNGICTGSLLNNTANDGHPYFLTADHCVGANVSNWVFRFNWQSTTCVGNNVGTFQTVSGSQLLASGGSADYALLRINNGSPIPTSYDPYYAGWDASGANPTSQVAIHHPSGDLKKISFDVNPAGTANYGGATCWRIFNWEDGTTEPGSSGSPLFDQNKRVIGQLYGGQATCSNNVNDYYGKFDVTYPNICQWIAPGCNTLVLDGYDPNAATVSNDVQLLNIIAPDGTYCGATVTPQITVRNAGSLNLTSFTIQFDVNGGASSSQSWTGNLASGNSVVVNLPAITPGAGSATFNVTLSNPNGTADENPANNSGNSAFTMIPDGQIVDFSILTDNYPGETTWTIVDDANNIIFSDGPYASTQTTYNYSFCLSAGCYTLNVFDSFGDGLQYQGVVGNYTLTGPDGTVLAQMIAGGNFGSLATHEFCLSPVGVEGCTNALACNYNSEATTDDGSCILPDGCTNPAACNYNPAALCDNGSCALPNGCTDNGACNFNPAATCDNGTCEYLSCAGCTNSGACNYEADASIDDGSCVMPNTYYVDNDGDGFGAGAPTLLCAPQAGYSSNNLDCDDNNASVYPDAPGTGEDIDNNCDGVVSGDEVYVCLGDFNNDGERNIGDMLIILGDMGCNVNCVADLNGDTVTNVNDFLIFASVFGTPCD